MIKLLHLIDRYMEIHPIRFWGLMFILFVLLVSFIIGFLFLISYKKSKKKARASENPSSNIVKYKWNHVWLKKTAIGAGFVIIGFMIGILTGKCLFSGGDKPIVDNISDSEYVFGIDISHYVGDIDWKKVKTSHHPIEFVFMRSTMGADGKDNAFEENWAAAKKLEYIRGAYHYYRAKKNEDAASQFKNFAATVTLGSGDMVPVLDVEEIKKLTRKELREGVLTWLKLAEEKYGVKPIVYTNQGFYLKYLDGYIDGYPLWIAAYSGKQKLEGIDWTFHQLSKYVQVEGIEGYVDGVDFKGNLDDLKNMCLK